MYVDASALVAIALGEADRTSMIERIAAARQPHTSVISAFETVMAIGRETGERSNAAEFVKEILESGGIELRGVERELLPDLAAVHAAYGKGTGHPARLNMGDCFSYAMAKRMSVPLLYKGDDFAHTDLA